MIKETENDTWVVGYMLKARTFISKTNKKTQPHKQKNQNNSQDIDIDIELCIKIHTLLPFQQWSRRVSTEPVYKKKKKKPNQTKQTLKPITRTTSLSLSLSLNSGYKVKKGS